jgi:HK97 family phage portal protein
MAGLIDLWHRFFPEQKAPAAPPEGLPISALVAPDPWRVAFGEPSAQAMIVEGYRKNSAVFACIRALAEGFPEPPARTYHRRPDGTRGDPWPEHPLQPLLHKPNHLMGWGELAAYLMIYRAIGGNAYLYKLRSNLYRPARRRAQPAELWPYHQVQMWPVPAGGEHGTKWVDHYAYALGKGKTMDVDPADVIHWKALPDPIKPWQGMPPMFPVAREIDTDNELTSYLFSLLANDAVPRGLISVPPQKLLTKEEKDEFRNDWNRRHAGGKRGGIGFLYGGMKYERVALNLAELALDALRGVPEARIASAFGVPPIIAGLPVGLARSTYSNYEEARKAFTQQTLVPHWRSLASELQADLAAEYDDEVLVEFDLSHVAALAEDVNVRHSRTKEAYDSGIITLNEARSQFGLGDLAGGDTLRSAADVPAAPVDPEATAGSKSRLWVGWRQKDAADLERHLASLEDRLITQLDTRLVAIIGRLAAQGERE